MQSIKLLNHYASEEISEEEDRSLSLTNDVMFDLSSVLGEMLVGSIHEDLESLKTLQATDRVCTSIALERLAYVLLDFRVNCQNPKGHHRSYCA